MRNTPRAVFAAVPRTGIYVTDLMAKLARHKKQDIESAIAMLSDHQIIKKAGCTARPMYVRLQSTKPVQQFFEENAI